MSASDLLSHAAWFFLPGIVTGYVQSFYYTIVTRAGEPKPQSGSVTFNRDRKRIHALVILTYLLYTVYETDYQLRLKGDFYQTLGVPHSVSERAIQSRFRRLTVQYHPDKLPDSEKSAAESRYVALQLARDTLADPAKRFAYDRLGPEVLTWDSTKLLRDYLFAGLQHMAGYYIASTTVLVLLSVFGYMEAGKFWRYWVLAALLAVEIHMITRPTFPGILTHAINPVLEWTGLRAAYLPYQLLSLLRKLSITFFIALNQLAPFFSSPAVAQPSDPSKIAPELLDRLDALTQATDREMSRLLSMELSPFASDPRHMKELKQGVKGWLVQNTVRNDPEVKAAVAEVLESRKRHGIDAAGASGSMGRNA